MKFHLQYNLTLQDFYEYQRAFQKHRRSLRVGVKRRFPMRPLLVGAVFIFVILMELLVPKPAPPPAPLLPPPAAPLTDLWITLLPYLVIFGFLFIFIFTLRRSKLIYRRVFDELPKLVEPQSVDIDDESISMRMPGCESTMQWSYFIRLIETKSDLILFYNPRGSAHIIPKRAFASEQDMKTFRDFGFSHIGNQPIGFPVELPKMPLTASPP